MERPALFLETLTELERYVSAGDDYSMLRASALLRQLLLDEKPLVHQINRLHRLKLRFAVCGRRYTKVVLEHNPVFYSALGGIHISTAPFPDPEQLSLDKFLQTPILKLGPQILSIADLISIAANVIGGVHKGDPKSDKELALIEFGRYVRVGGGGGSQPIHAAQLKPVVLIVLDSLKPLRDAIKAEPKAD